MHKTNDVVRYKYKDLITGIAYQTGNDRFIIRYVSMHDLIHRTAYYNSLAEIQTDWNFI